MNKPDELNVKNIKVLIKHKISKADEPHELAKVIVQRIFAGEDHETLDWLDGGQWVAIQMGAIFPGAKGPRATSGPMRFRIALEGMMLLAGWTRKDSKSRIGFMRPALHVKASDARIPHAFDTPTSTPPSEGLVNSVIAK